ncbi:Putative quinoprotein alcohol dehydrogenase-like superfamily [Septoria linicola]|uniref:Guanine nucleotide-exchange factor SEC12 n=1 Tax=Septoria linicola TaxID=215465 RepID=A0A9Q9EIU9_9PEZI|nr:putative quinoprotein alcohol dehydrogenase-like superfamily [Septoria linicola]USW51494.1 Putative quinoprotein alcohol dehydrogenase-like superfamily [Septoria linicola]
MPSFTNSDVSYAKHTLDYPVYAADFDPYNRGYLVIAGGGGEGRSGVPNKISLLDINNRATIEPVTEIDLSRDEDSIQSLANLATKDGLITLAGINSSAAAQNDNKNEHFRAFDIRYPPRKKQKTDDAASGSSEKGEIKLLGKRSLFKSSTAPKKETYQRLLRLSPVGKRDAPGKRIGAIASGFAKESEIIVFDATAAIPDDRDVVTRIDLDKHEAADLDIARIGDDNLFSLAYCDEHTIWEQTYKYDFEKKKVDKRPNGPRRAYQMVTSDDFQAKGSRPKFKALRFLNSENLVALVNKPNKSGVELRVYHLYPTGPALVMQTKKLPGHIKQATSLDVGALDADNNGSQQFTLAVSGQDSSIEVMTVSYQAMTDTFSSIRSYMSLRDVHKQGITKICWQPFHSPTRAADQGATTGKNGESLPAQKPQNPGPQYARLASVSFGNTLVIETFPLTPLEPKNKDSRYVLSHPADERFWTLTIYGLFLFIGLVTSVLFYSFLSAGSSWNIVPNSLSNFLDQPAAAAHHRDILSQAKVPDIAVPTAASNLKDALAEHHASPEDAAATAVVVHHLPDSEGVSVAVHPDKEAYLAHESTDAKQWDDLEPQQQKFWKSKLKKAGQWAEHEGEAVLKGVLWSTVPQFLMGHAGEILREL